MTVQIPLGMQPDAATIGPFSPDGSQFALNLAQVYSQTIVPPLLAVVNLADSTLAQTLDLMATYQDQGVLMLDWTPEGITLAPTCLACGGRISGFYDRWNPVTGDLTRNVQYFNFLGDFLPGTGEIVIQAQDPNLPVVEQNGMFPPANVIHYLPDGDPEAPVIVYHDPANLDLAYPQWVADGSAYLLHNWGDTSATLIFRDGHERVIELPPGDAAHRMQSRSRPASPRRRRLGARGRARTAAAHHGDSVCRRC
jgi:hypothetical protein